MSKELCKVTVVAVVEELGSECYIHIKPVKPNRTNLPEERPVNNVFNLYSKTLTPDQLSILSKGLKFIPTTD